MPGGLYCVVVGLFVFAAIVLSLISSMEAVAGYRYIACCAVVIADVSIPGDESR